MIARVLHTIKNNKGFVIINAIFLLIYSLICFVNHYNFRTYALDLGTYTRALFDYAHFRFNYCEMFVPEQENMLSAHFDLLLMLFSPLYWVFGNITLLVIQIAAIHFGAFGIYKLAQSNHLSKTTILLTCIVFLASFGVFSAMAYDYHSNVVAACLLPWFVLFFKREQYLKSAIIFILILVAKENMALWLFCVCIGFLFIYKSSSQKKMAVVFSFLSIAYFMLIIFLVMPALSLQKNYNHFEFHALGNSFRDVLFNIIQHPIKAISLLFENNTSNEKLNYIKTETWLFWLISGGFLFFYRPVFLWMLLPIMMQKMYHDDSGKWSVSGQYNIEFAPLAAWCLIECIKGISYKKQIWITSIAAILCIAVTIRLCDNTTSFVDKTRIRFYQEMHYKSDIDTKEAYALIDKIPKNAIVSAQGVFVPHLIDRKMIYQFPIVKNAQYILLSDIGSLYPLSKQQMLKQIDSLCLSPKWHHSPLNNHLYLFEISEKH